ESRYDRVVGTRPVGGDDTDVVEHGLPAVGSAAREVDLELTGKQLRVGVAKEVPECSLGPGADVEHLERAGHGEGATGDVADGVAAGLTRGEIDRRELEQQRRHR